MEAKGRPGVIINIGSSSGLYPMFPDPIYSGSKGLYFSYIPPILYFYDFSIIK